MPRPLLASILLALLAALASPGAAEPPAFLAFESGPVRPLALSPDRRRLFVANTPDGRLEVFRVHADGLVPEASIPVGLEPVAVAARSAREVWVVNHLSDSISIVDVRRQRVTRTLLVGDEPRDLVFAGGRAFVTTAHRGQQRTHPSLADVPGAGDPELTTPGVPRADVWVFDAADPGPGVGGRPLRIVSLFGDTPRALAVSPDEKTVYAAVFLSGNGTTALAEGLVCDQFPAPDDEAGLAAYDPDVPCEIDGLLVPGGVPGPATNQAGVRAPEVGLIVRQDAPGGAWRDERGRDWSAAVRFDLPDLDVFAIDAESLETVAAYPQVGTALFNMTVNPKTGALYVSNTEARNEVRFEGPGTFVEEIGAKPAGVPPTVQGHMHEARISVIDGGRVLPRHLNKHLDYEVRPAPIGDAEHSLATPLEMVVTQDGETLYVAAYGSSRIGVLSTDALLEDRFDPRSASASYLPVSGGGPAGLALDERRKRLYVLTRFDNSVSVLDTRSGEELAHVALSNPEPAALVAGRPVLYDAQLTSSNGEASCSSCHVFADLDGLAWDLGDPDGEATFNNMEVNLNILTLVLQGAGGFPNLNGSGAIDEFSALKGPMTTQTLRGMVFSGPMHWRGDRVNGFFGIDAPGGNDARLSFLNFIVAFPGLVGSRMEPEEPELQELTQKFADFALALALPPNPVRALDNQLSPAEARGLEFYVGGPDPENQVFSDGIQAGILAAPNVNGLTCNDCHDLDPAQGFFGTDGKASFEAETQLMKVPHLRNLYQKVGMFGMASSPTFFLQGENEHLGPQVRGFGFMHDGATDTLFRFFRSNVFDPETFTVDLNNDGTPEVIGAGFQNGDVGRGDMEQFMLAFDSDLAPVVGQQVTLTRRNADEVGPRIELLRERSEAAFTSRLLGGEVTECELIARATLRGASRGWLHEGAGRFLGDDGVETDEAALRRLAARGNPVTFSCAPPGSGRRMALDRDLDGVFDRLDNCPVTANPAQDDIDRDRVGDACDNCPGRRNRRQLDPQGDGRGARCTPRGA